MFGKKVPVTISSVVSDIQEKVTVLRNLAEQHSATALVQRDIAERAHQQRLAEEVEANRATALAEKFEHLITV